MTRPLAPLCPTVAALLALACAPGGGHPALKDAGGSPPLPPPPVVDAGAPEADAGTTPPDDAGTDAGPALPTPEPMPSWSLGMGATEADEGIAVAADPEGYVTVAGTFRGELPRGGITHRASGETDVFVTAVGPDGTHRWTEIIGGASTETLGGIAADSDGNVYVAGRFTERLVVGGRVPLTAEQSEIFVASFDRDGALRWARAFGGEWSEGAQAIAVAGDRVCIAGDMQGGFTFGTAVLPPVWQYDAFVACMNRDDAAPRWARAFGGAGNDVGTSVAIGPDGTVYLGLSFEHELTVDAETLTAGGSFDVAVVAMDPIGETVWTRALPGPDADSLEGLAADASGVYVTGVFTGSIDLGGGRVEGWDRHDLYVAAYGTDGAHRWGVAYGDEGFDQPLDLAVGGGFVHVTGRFDGSLEVGHQLLEAAGDYDVLFVTLGTNDGAVAHAEAIGSGLNDQGNGVAADPFGGAYLTGYVGDATVRDGVTLGGAGHIDTFLVHVVPAPLR